MASEFTAATSESGCMLDEEILATVRTNPDKPASVNVLRKRFNVGWGRAKRLFKLYRAEELGCAPSDVPILPPGARPQGDSGRRLVKKENRGRPTPMRGKRVNEGRALIRRRTILPSLLYNKRIFERRKLRRS